MVVVVTVTEGVAVQPEAGFLCSSLRRAGASPVLLPTDFCTDEDGFRATLQAHAPAAVVLAYQPEFREILGHLGEVARRAMAVPVTIVGSALTRQGVGTAFPEGVGQLGSAVDGSTGGIVLGREAPGAADPRGLPLDLDVFGGEDLLAHPLAASLFAETETIGLLATRGSVRRLAPTALLARLEAPLPQGPVELLPAAATAPLEGFGVRPVRVEWWDRHAGPTVLARAAELAALGIASSARVMPEGLDPEVTLLAARAAGVDRVVFEVDRLADIEPGPGTAATAEDLEPWFDAARALGLQTGVLLVVGLPGETPAAGRARTGTLRRLAPDCLRCVPFEATGGTPMEDLLRERDALPEPDLRWNRELHRPLRQACLDAEGFTANWSEALLLLAEREAGRSMAS